MSICCLNLCTSSRSSSRDGPGSDWVVATTGGSMTDCFRSVTPVAVRIDTVGTGKQNESIHLTPFSWLTRCACGRDYGRCRRDCTRPVVLPGSEFMDIRPVVRCRCTWKQSDSAIKGHRDHSPVNALLTGEAKNGLISLGDFSPEASLRRYHQPRSASRITTVPPATPPAIAAALV